MKPKNVESLTELHSTEDDIAYVHTRIDQLIRQVALEVGLNDRTRLHLSKEQWGDAVRLASNRFWGADDTIAEQFDRPKRERQ